MLLPRCVRLGCSVQEPWAPRDSGHHPQYPSTWLPIPVPEALAPVPLTALPRLPATTGRGPACTPYPLLQEAFLILVWPL